VKTAGVSARRMGDKPVWRRELIFLAPSKPCFILSRIVGIAIDVYAGYSAIAKFEQIAETSARSCGSRPRFSGHFAV